MQIEIWHGMDQKVGHLGECQDDFNVLGMVSDVESLQVLTYSLNSEAAIELTVGNDPSGFGDCRRLMRTGHFNADIPITSLRPGINTVLIAAADTQGKITTATLNIEKRNGAYPMPVSIDWEKVINPQDVGQYVDGEWRIENGGLRTMHTGYDRIFLIGEKSWQDYEVLVPVTINGVEKEIGPNSGSGNGVGILLRFTGHVAGGPRDFGYGQPKWGYQPFGGICWLHWTDRSSEPPYIQFYRGDNDNKLNYERFPVVPGETCWMKARCETLPDIGRSNHITRYSFKVWGRNMPEPEAWAFAVEQTSKHALQKGGLLLIAHHVDATFGNVRIFPQ